MSHCESRRRLLLTLLPLATGTAMGVNAGWVGRALAADSPSASKDTEPPEPPANLPPLKVTIDKARVDLAEHHLEVKMTRPAGRVELKIFDESGFSLAEVSQSFLGKPPGAPLVVRWHPSSDDPVGRIEVYAYDKYDFFQGIAIVPWSFSVPHEEVVFETNSAAIRESEESKLSASLATILEALDKYKELGAITLFIAGHTDTKGKPQHNQQLSAERARAIATWFRSRGLSLSISYAGFGESALKVPTPDETDEPQNRRVDYVLSIDTPRFKTTGTAPVWRALGR